MINYATNQCTYSIKFFLITLFFTVQFLGQKSVADVNAHLRVFTNGGENGQLLREFVVEQSEPGAPLRLVYVNFQYMVNGKVRAMTMDDVKLVKVEGNRIQLFLDQGKGVPTHYKAAEKVLSEHRLPYWSRILFKQIHSIEISLEDVPQVRTRFYFNSNPRHTFLSANERNKIQDVELIKSERFFLDANQANEYQKARAGRLKTANYIIDRGWVKEAEHRGLLIRLPRVKSQDREQSLMKLKLSHPLESNSAKGFVLHFESRQYPGEFERVIVSGNIRTLSQFLSLVYLYSPNDFDIISSMRSGAERALHSIYAKYVGWYPAKANSHRDAPYVLQDLIEQGSQSLGGFERLLIDPIKSKLCRSVFAF